MRRTPLPRTQTPCPRHCPNSAPQAKGLGGLVAASKVPNGTPPCDFRAANASPAVAGIPDRKGQPKGAHLRPGSNSQTRSSQRNVKCASRPTSSRLCRSVHTSAQVCTSMQTCAQLCPHAGTRRTLVHECAHVCTLGHTSAHVCTLTGALTLGPHLCTGVHTCAQVCAHVVQ